MQIVGNANRARLRRATLGIVVSMIGLIAIFYLLYLIGHLPLD
jgi:hypothetical protein